MKAGWLLLLALLPQAPATGNLQGVVLNGANEGIYGARVEITGGAQGAIVTRTDGQGQFVFGSLPAGRYRLSVKKEGYVRQEYGQKDPGEAGAPIVIGAGSQVKGLVFRLLPAATIAGAVRNEDGFPIANILVQALRRSYGVRGNRTITLFSNALTDDLGAYRLYWLDPGEYYINASYLPQLPTAVNANEDAPRAAYGPTYYPGSADGLEAKPVRVEGGAVFGGIDFKLQRSPAVRVRGTIYSILTRNATPATVTLMAPDESGSTARYSVQTDAKGVFEMKGVNPGSYVVSAKSMDGDGQLGFSTIKVVEIDYPRADVVVGPGVTINTRLFGEAPASADMRAMQVALLPLETFLPTPNASLSNVQPGDYLLRVSGLPGDAYVQAAQSAGRDVLEQFVQVQYENQASLDIQLAFDGGQINGTVLDPAGQAASGSTLVLVPDRTRRHRPDQYRVGTSGADGKFSIRGIPPGEYKVFAWKSVEPNAYLNADFLMPYEELGAPAKVGPRETLQAQIRLIPGN